METVLDLVSGEQGGGCSAPARSNGPQADGDLARVRFVAETYRSARCLYAQGARLIARSPASVCPRLVSVVRCDSMLCKGTCLRFSYHLYGPKSLAMLCIRSYQAAAWL